MIVPLTPLQFLRRAERLFARKVAVVDGDQRFTYVEFGQRCHRLANALLASGLNPGDRVAVLAPNSHALLEAYFGVLEAGGVLLPLNIRLHHAELARIVDHAQPRFLMVDLSLEDRATEVREVVKHRPELVWIGGRAEERPELCYETWLAGATDIAPPDPVSDENGIAELFYTSGTTGEPKGVMLTHRNLYLHAMSFLVAFRAAESDVQLHSIPLFHVNGWGTPQALTAVGATHVMLRSFEPGRVLQLIERERVTRFFAVPTMLTMLLEHKELRQYDLSSLELINTGGAPTPPELVRRAERAIGCRVVGGYGLTETSPIICFAADKSTLAHQDEELRLRRQASTGMPLVGTELTIVDDGGVELPWDGTSVGEIAVRSNVVSPGYWDDPESTARASRDGRFLTGDLASIDPEGYVTIVDRKKELIVSGGENVSSIEVERVLHKHPAVLECAVFGVPDARWGEAVKAVVCLREGGAVDGDGLVDFCRGHLAGFKVPRSVDFMDRLPRSGTGKVLKRQLRERYWRELDRKA